MVTNITFGKKKRPFKLIFILILFLILLITVLILGYSSHAEIGVRYEDEAETTHKMSCEVVYSISDKELGLEFGKKENAPKAFGVVRRCENREVVCYYIGTANSMFCQFKNFYTTRSKGTLRPE